VHVKDLAHEGSEPAEQGWATLGEGRLPWGQWLPGLATRLQTFIVEHDHPTLGRVRSVRTPLPLESGGERREREPHLAPRRAVAGQEHDHQRYALLGSHECFRRHVTGSLSAPVNSGGVALVHRWSDRWFEFWS